MNNDIIEFFNGNKIKKALLETNNTNRGINNILKVDEILWTKIDYVSPNNYTITYGFKNKNKKGWTYETWNTLRNNKWDDVINHIKESRSKLNLINYELH